MRVVEAAGRTVDDAVRDALRQLGARRDDVEIEVVEEGSRGLFGLLGTRRARVRVQLKPDVEAPAAVDGNDEAWDEEEGAEAPEAVPTRDGGEAARTEVEEASAS